MKTEHTPGPWTIAGDCDRLSVVQENSDNANACDGVRRVALVTCGDFEFPDYDEHSANARLIAAAPELLEALELITAHYDDLSKSNPGFMGKLCLQDYGLWNRALLAMSAAIRKAKGTA